MITFSEIRRTYLQDFFEKEGGKYEDILSPANRWLALDTYLRIFGKKFMKNIGFDADKHKSGTKNKIPKKRNRTDRTVHR